MRKSDIRERYKLSPMQQGMLFDYLLAPNSGADIQQMICHFREDLNVEVFKRAWETVVEEHAVFRTSYRWDDLEAPQQEVHSEILLPWEEQDWRGLPGEEQDRRLEGYLGADRVRGFDLAKAPVFRLLLVRTGESDYRFVWTNHHIMHDGRTRFIVFKEVFARYEALLRDEAIELESPRPYREYIDWLEQQELHASETYFRELLKDLPSLPLQTEHLPPEVAGSRAGDKGEQELRFSAELTSALKGLAEKNGLRLSTMVHGAWGMLLSCYSGEEDVVFGEVRACRGSALEGAESMVGLFMNNLPLRVRLPSGRPLLSYLKEIREQQVSLRAHEHTPLAKIYEWVGQPSGRQLFESFVLFDNVFVNTALQAQGGSWKNREFRLQEKANFPLVLYAWGEPEMVLRIAYDRARFSDSTIARMCENLETVLRGMAEDPEGSVTDIPIVPVHERRRLIEEWNATEADYPRERTIHGLFEEQAERGGHKVAAVLEGQELTYGELNRRANRVAHYLRGMGVGPEVPVGICMERSVDMLVGLMGILKAGGAYVPLDPEYPRDRLAYMLEDAQVSVLVTQEALKADLPESGARVVCLDADREEIAKESLENPDCAAKGDGAAYVIYTSGSTGNPKGVVGLHRGALNRFYWMWKTYPFEEGEVCCQKTSLSFVDSVWEIFGPLLQGVPTVMIPDEHVKDPRRLIEDLAAHGVTRIVLVPSLLRVILEAHEDLQNRLPGLKIWVTSGEEIPVELAERFYASMPGSVLINLYGSSEVSADATCYEVPKGELGRSIPIGRPIDNTTIYVLDSNLRPVPIGVGGEIYVGGEGLARGYFNREDLTGERFPPNPFRQGGVIYKTGDLGRYLPDGSIEYLGRSDHQVKIRGFRIELGEIEGVLSRYPGVREKVVVAREDETGERHLVAYIVSDGNGTVTAQDLRASLRERLPDYMVPSTFVFLDALPLTPSGKIDRRSLPVSEGKRPELEHAYVPPRSELQRFLSGVWSKVLELDQVGVHDMFFELGGTSIRAVGVVNRIRAELGEDIPVISIFEAPSIAGYVEYLKRHYPGAVEKRFPNEAASTARATASGGEGEQRARDSASKARKLKRELEERQRRVRRVRRGAGRGPV
jgi:amino acid adenylation domain-containing protein